VAVEFRRLCHLTWHRLGPNLSDVHANKSRCRIYERLRAEHEASSAAAEEEERLINLLREEQEVCIITYPGHVETIELLPAA
jgi:hypothetical protein